jgi:Phytanoyl-CoA dioxygenase (PhyH)
MVADLLTDALARIDRLVEANRRNRSTETDELLVKLRRDAASQVSSRDAGDIPEPPSEDLFAGITGLPEIDASRLTVAHLASGILHHGALLVRGVVGAKHLEIMTALLDKKEASAPPTPNADDDESKRQQFSEAIRYKARKGLPRMMCSPTAVYDIIEMYKEVGLGQTISEYLGERPVLHTERIRLTRHRGAAGLPWHQDAAFYCGVFYAVNVWLAISPCGADAPGLNVIPRRFDDVCGIKRGESLPLPLTYGERFTPELIREIADGHPVSDPDFRPGDALLFDELTMHRTSPGGWKVPYKDSAVTWFLAPSRVPAAATPLAF